MNIVDLPDGETVPGPGIYRCSLKHYHSQDICPGPSVSSSGLRKIWSESPYHFWMQSDLNEDRMPPKEESEALALGKAAHALILGEEHFDTMFAYVPDDAPPRPTATQIKAFERDGEWSDNAAPRAEYWEAWDAKNGTGKTLITYEMVKKISRMADSIRSNPLALEVLTGALTEISMVWEDPLTGVWLKSRVDVMPDNGADFADLKTFAPRTKSVKRAAHQTITDNEYPMQIGLGQMGAAVFGMTAEECVLVMIQSTEPFCCVPTKLDADCLYWGRVKNRWAINTFAACLETGYWPQPVEGLLEYTTPESQLHRLSEMQRKGELPSLAA